MKKGRKKKTENNSREPEQNPPISAEQLQLEELSGSDDLSTLDVSDTDEDENEGVGDGNIGRSQTDTLDEK